MNRNRNHIVGGIVFRHEGNGCLTAKYHHDGSRECPFTESCKLIDREVTNDVFIGRYRTVWLEDSNRNHAAELLIEQDPTNNALYKLTWGNTANPTFEGSGMLFEDFLVCTYWD